MKKTNINSQNQFQRNPVIKNSNETPVFNTGGLKQNTTYQLRCTEIPITKVTKRSTAKPMPRPRPSPRVPSDVSPAFKRGKSMTTSKKRECYMEVRVFFL